MATTTITPPPPPASLITASCEGNIRRLLECISSEETIDINACDISGRSALHFARNSEVVEFLMKAGADILLLDKYGANAAHAAARRNKVGNIYIFGTS